MARKKLRAKSRRRLYKIVGQIYRLLQDDNWSVRLDRIDHNAKFCKKHDIPIDTEGFCNRETESIYVDFRYCLLSTLIHECLHAIYPDHQEKQILKLEKFVIQNISPIQAKRILLMAIDKL